MIAGSDFTRSATVRRSVSGLREASNNRTATPGSVGRLGDDQIFCGSIMFALEDEGTVFGRSCGTRESGFGENRPVMASGTG